MHDPIVLERSTLLALVAVLAKEIKRSSRLADLALDPDVKALHREATLQLCTLDCLVAEEMRSLITVEDDDHQSHLLIAPHDDDDLEDPEIADANNNHGQDPKPTEGWTGKKCPSCKGPGFKHSHAHDNEIPCGRCGGTGDEYGDLGPGGCDDPLMA